MPDHGYHSMSSAERVGSCPADPTGCAVRTTLTPVFPRHLAAQKIFLLGQEPIAILCLPATGIVSEISPLISIGAVLGGSLGHLRYVR